MSQWVYQWASQPQDSWNQEVSTNLLKYDKLLMYQLMDYWGLLPGIILTQSSYQPAASEYVFFH